MFFGGQCYNFLDFEEMRLFNYRSLKAIECCGTMLVLTELGKKMKQLPVEPRLAKMVLDSVQYNLVAEAAVVCACVHIGSLFHRENRRNVIF